MLLNSRYGFPSPERQQEKPPTSSSLHTLMSKVQLWRRQWRSNRHEAVRHCALIKIALMDHYIWQPLLSLMCLFFPNIILPSTALSVTYTAETRFSRFCFPVLGPQTVSKVSDRSVQTHADTSRHTQKQTQRHLKHCPREIQSCLVTSKHRIGWAHVTHVGSWHWSSAKAKPLCSNTGLDPVSHTYCPGGTWKQKMLLWWTFPSPRHS